MMRALAVVAAVTVSANDGVCDCTGTDDCWHSGWAVPCSTAGSQSNCEGSGGQWCGAPAPTPPPAPSPPAACDCSGGDDCWHSGWAVPCSKSGSRSNCEGSGGTWCGDSPTPTPTPSPPSPSPPGSCVAQAVLKCINDYSSYWPKCDPSQSKTVVGPSGYEFGYYCTQEWADALNSMLTTVGKCGDAAAIKKLLGETTYETGYFSTVYQPVDGGAGLIHMIPGNWPVNAGDMDTLFGNKGYAAAAQRMGKSFFQSSQYGWLSVAAWYKSTNRVVGGCGLDLFDQPYETQTRCILGRVVDRSESYNVASRCFDQFMSGANASVVV